MRHLPQKQRVRHRKDASLPLQLHKRAKRHVVPHKLRPLLKRARTPHRVPNRRKPRQLLNRQQQKVPHYLPTRRRPKLKVRNRNTQPAGPALRQTSAPPTLVCKPLKQVKRLVKQPRKRQLLLLLPVAQPRQRRVYHRAVTRLQKITRPKVGVPARLQKFCPKLARQGRALAVRRLFPNKLARRHPPPLVQRVVRPPLRKRGALRPRQKVLLAPPPLRPLPFGRRLPSKPQNGPKQPPPRKRVSLLMPRPLLQ